MHTITLNLISKNDVCSLTVKSSNKELFNQFVTDWFSLFHHSINEETKELSLDSLQRKSKDFLLSIDAIIDKYGEVLPKIRQFRTFLGTIENDEHFVFLPFGEVGRDDFRDIHLHLIALKDNKSLEEVHAEFDSNFGKLFDAYRIFHANGRRKHFVGEYQKDLRICRFCGLRQDTGASFNNKSHTISEALGNKRIFTNDECDTCNEKLNQEIEQDIITYLTIYRIFFKVKGKERSPKIKGNNFELTNNENVLITHYEKKTPISKDNPSVKLDFSQKIAMQNIYKTLCKYAIGIAPDEQLQEFSRIIKWINGEQKIAQLPVIATSQDNSMYVNHPEISLFLRATEDANAPICFARFRFTILTYVFIIPSDNDIKDYTNGDSYKSFWESEYMQSIRNSTNWIFQDFSDDIKQNFILNLTFNLPGGLNT